MQLSLVTRVALGTYTRISSHLLNVHVHSCKSVTFRYEFSHNCNMETNVFNFFDHTLAINSIKCICNTFVQSYDIASEALNNFKKIHYMY